MSPRTTRAWAAAGTVAVAALVNITTGVLTEKWTSAWCAFLAVLVVVGGRVHQRMGGSGEQAVIGSEIGADLIQEQG